MLDRITNLDGRLKSFATVTADQALAAARTAEDEIRSGNYRGILHGVPIALKDLCFTNGVRTMGGLSVNKGFIPDYDATVVTRLANAGAISLGKLNMTEGATASYHPDFDIPLNPWNEGYWSGVSSSGSGVAVAAGLCFAALGSDTGGSIRFPSMANGIVGLKPTYGRVSRFGVMPLSETLDHIGPMTRSVADAAAVFQAIAGRDPNDATSLAEPVPDLAASFSGDLRGVRIGFDRTFASEDVNPGLTAAITAAVSHLASLGAEVIDVNLRQDWANVGQTWFEICSRDFYKAQSAHYPAHASEYGSPVASLLAMGATISDETFEAALARRAILNRQFEDAIANVDAVIAPAGITFPVTQMQLYGDPASYADYEQQLPIRFTFPADLAGAPSLTLPCGFADEGIPYAMQIIGPRMSEAMLCRIGNAYEANTDWKDRHPSV